MPVYMPCVHEAYSAQVYTLACTLWEVIRQINVHTSKQDFRDKSFLILRGEALLFVNTFKCWEVLSGVLCPVQMLMYSKQNSAD